MIDSMFYKQLTEYRIQIKRTKDMNEFEALVILSLFQVPGWYVGCNLRDEHKDKKCEDWGALSRPLSHFSQPSHL